MRGNTFGKLFSITSFGESHGKAVGVVIDGMPSNIEIDEKKLQECLDKRRPGRLKGTTSRDEKDLCNILSGIYQGKTLGSPIAVIVENKNHRSKDYEVFKNMVRPGHADQTSLDKFGIRDHRGGGRASGRETIARVIGGYFASLILPQIEIFSYISKLGPFESKERPVELNEYSLDKKFSSSEIEKYLIDLKEQGDSVGGIITTVIKNSPKGLGEPAFDKLKADLSKAMLSIGACTGFLMGENVLFENITGLKASSNHHYFGGIEGGISNGDEICFRTIFKPTSTVGEKAKLGRHDPCILPRAIYVVNAMASITLADHYLRQKAYSF